MNNFFIFLRRILIKDVFLDFTFIGGAGFFEFKFVDEVAAFNVMEFAS